MSVSAIFVSMIVQDLSGFCSTKSACPSISNSTPPRLRCLRSGFSTIIRSARSSCSHNFEPAMSGRTNCERNSTKPSRSAWLAGGPWLCNSSSMIRSTVGLCVRRSCAETSLSTHRVRTLWTNEPTSSVSNSPRESGRSSTVSASVWSGRPWRWSRMFASGFSESG